MGSTDEINKYKNVKKKLEFNASEKVSDSNCDPKLNSKVEPHNEVSENDNEESRGKPIPSSSNINIHAPRVRNSSESSGDGGKSPNMDRMKRSPYEKECSLLLPLSSTFVSPISFVKKKRQRTVSDSSPVQNFIYPGIAASPPKFMSLEEVMKAAYGVSNMVLAHEIAVDKNFKLEKFDPPDNSIEKQVSDVMHKAFWDNLSSQLAEDPPCYIQAFVLLKEVCDNLLDVTLPQHTRLRQEINETLDIDLIKQQAEHGVLDFKQYSQYVLSVMAKLCAPVRDEIVKSLMLEDDVVKVFRGVLETLDLMRLDMANFTIQQIRPHIIAQSVEYEKKKFSEFLKTQSDGLELTREWLVDHIYPEDQTVSVTDKVAMRSVVNKVMSRAYFSLLNWPEDKLMPETVLLDGSRLLELKDRLMQVCVLGTTLLVTMSAVGPIVVHPDVLKIKLKRNLCSILDPALSEKDTLDSIANISEQAIKDVNEHLADNDRPLLLSSSSAALKAQILEIEDPEHRVRALISKRAGEFIEAILNSTSSNRVQMPPGLSSLQEELAHICGTLLRLVSHNRAVFGEYYADIIKNHIEKGNSSFINESQLT